MIFYGQKKIISNWWHNPRLSLHPLLHFAFKVPTLSTVLILLHSISSEHLEFSDHAYAKAAHNSISASNMASDHTYCAPVQHDINQAIQDADQLSRDREYHDISVAKNAQVQMGTYLYIFL